MLRFHAVSKSVKIYHGDFQIGKVVYEPGKFWQYRLNDGRNGAYHEYWTDAAQEAQEFYNDSN